MRVTWGKWSRGRKWACKASRVYGQAEVGRWYGMGNLEFQGSRISSWWLWASHHTHLFIHLPTMTWALVMYQELCTKPGQATCPSETDHLSERKNVNKIEFYNGSCKRGSVLVYDTGKSPWGTDNLRLKEREGVGHWRQRQRAFQEEGEACDMGGQ